MQTPAQSQRIVLVSLLLILIKHVTPGFSQRVGTILLTIFAYSFKTLKFDLIINMNELLTEIALENGRFQVVVKTRETF